MAFTFPPGTTLNVYNTPGGENGTLECVADTNCLAAIGGNEDEACGTVNIYSGKVIAKADVDAAGIGGGDDGFGGYINIYGGTINATGGSTNSDGGSSGSITITGGTVRAKCLATFDSWNNRPGEAAGIGDGMNAHGDPERIITISGGDIVAETVEANHTGERGGAGIGAGYGGGGAENMKIIITGGKIVANGCNHSAGIGGSHGKYVGEISISGDADIIARGGEFGAGIGGGAEAKSGKITISGGKIEAYGGYGGAGIGSGVACTEDEDAVDITINGGNIKASGGSRLYDHDTIYFAGASIGAGGCTQRILYGTDPGDIKDVSYFAGTINLNGGTITAINPIGTTYEAALDGAQGEVYFNGATVQIETNENYPSVRATTIIFKDEEGIRQKVSYAESGSGPYTVVPKDDRIPTLKAVEKKYVKVSHCEHENMIYTDNPAGDNHKTVCPNCFYDDYDAHTYGDPVWSWAEDSRSATLYFPCVYCTHKISVAATIERIALDSDTGIETLQATVEHDGKTYTDTRQVYADDLSARLLGYTLSLEGDIGINFYMELSEDVANSETAKMHFTIPKNGEPDTKDIKVSEALQVKMGDKTYYVFKCQVAAKEMTSNITAQIIDGEKQGTVFTYSVKEYADYLLSHTEGNQQYTKAAPLVKAMLNYGAYSQIHFDKNSDKLANAGLTEAEKALGDVSIDVADYDVSNLPAGTTYAGATLSLKAETTLSLYFKSSSTLSFSCDGYTVQPVTSGDYQIARIRGIKAKDIDDVFTLNVSGVTVSYSPLNYCKDMLADDTQDDNLKNALKALYLYWEAADLYFNNGIDLRAVTGDTVIQNGQTIGGTLSGNHKISIADGATVRLRNANITSLDGKALYAGITLLGDATITLEGSNTLKGGANFDPGVYVPVGKTLTIDGTGSLYASSDRSGCGIGGGYLTHAGNITINGGTITAVGGKEAAGIGAGRVGDCGNITINGGTITANGGKLAAGIGSGNYKSKCGNITIANTVTKVTATKGEGAPYSIGAGEGDESSCGTVTIGGVVGPISKSPYTYQP